MTAQDPIPLTIISGFLGAGKTTLLNELLRQLSDQGKRVAIIQNEFSDVGVEDAFVTGGDGEILNDIVELANGCICCTVRDDFVSALEVLANQKRFDYFLLECSGLADPGSLASTFWVDDELDCSVKLDGIITVVDAAHLGDHLDGKDSESAQIIKQIAYADRILLNKTDIAPQDTLSCLKDRLVQLNATAEFLCTERSVVNFEDVLNISAFSIEKAEESVKKALENISHTHSSDCVHDHSVTSAVFERSDRGTSIAKVNQWMADLLWRNDGSEQKIFRLKAVLAVNDDSRRHFLQVVQQLFEVTEGSSWGDEKPVSRLVVIGRDLHLSTIEKSWIDIFDDEIKT
eukprot:469792_1